MVGLFKICKDFLNYLAKYKNKLLLIFCFPILMIAIYSFQEDVLFDNVATLAPQDLGDEFSEFKKYSVGSLEYLENNVSNVIFRSFLYSITSKKVARAAYKDQIYGFILKDQIFLEFQKKSRQGIYKTNVDEANIQAIHNYFKTVIHIDSSDRWSLDANIRLRNKDLDIGNYILQRIVEIADDVLLNEYRDFFLTKSGEQVKLFAQQESYMVSSAILKNIQDNEWISEKYLSSKPFSYKFTEIIEKPSTHSKPNLFANLFLGIIFSTSLIIAIVLSFVTKTRISANIPY